jgi:xanthine/CO dehydrogenase XdhC/CoxF family maturation factor
MGSRRRSSTASMPIGLFGPARDARSIAVCVLAQILALSGQPSD